MNGVNTLQVDIENYRHRGDKLPFFEDIHARFDGGNVSFLLGASGRGKTTLLRLLLGEPKGFGVSNIVYRVQGTLFSAREVQRAGRLGVVAQDSALVPWLTTQQNLRLPTRLNPSLPTLRTADIEQSIHELGLDTEILNKCPHELSFGMRQRVTLIRSLLYEPKFLLLDEMFTGLDPTNINRMARVLQEYVKNTSAVCLLITHNVAQASKLADRIYFMSRSRKLDLLPSRDISAIEQKFADDI